MSLKAGQIFRSEDRVIKLTVIQASNRVRKLRFKIENVINAKASYTVTFHRANGAEPERINYTTDGQEGNAEYELSAAEAVGIEIRRALS